MNKLAVVVGHNSQAQGAIRGDTGETEYVWNGRLARMMVELGPEYGLNVKDFRRVATGSYSSELQRVYSEVDRWGAMASMELHFNGAASQASGTETLSSGTALSLRLAVAVQDEVIATLGLRDRGVKTRTGSERGGKSLVSGRAPAILVEPFFGSSTKGQSATNELHEQEELARAYLRGAAAAMRTFPRASLDDSRTIDAVQRQRAASKQGATVLGGSVLAQTVSAVMGPVDSLQGAAQVFQPLAVYLPWAAGGLAVVGIALFAYNRWQSERIENARLEDHERELR